MLVFIFSVVVYAAFILTMGRLLVSKINGVPIQVLLPCAVRPITPEIEQEIRKVWRIKDIESIDDFCRSESDADSSPD